MENENALKLCDTVLEYVPEFKDHKDYSLWGKENPYLHFNNFGTFLVEVIESKSSNAQIVKRAFDFINDSYNNSHDEYIRTMLSVDIFEKFRISKNTIATAQKLLKDDALTVFDLIVKG